MVFRLRALLPRAHVQRAAQELRRLARRQAQDLRWASPCAMQRAGVSNDVHLYRGVFSDVHPY